MTAETKAVAKRRELSPEQQKLVDERRLHSHLVQQIRGATWGGAQNADTIAAIAAWSRENDVDPITEIDVLGGNLYLKARYYERKLSQLIAAGVIDYAKKDWVHVDKRLEKLADAGDAEAKEESKRRLRARIANNVSDEATAACVYRIKHRQMEQEVTGAKEYNPAGRADPVGKTHPMETIETRALRRAMLQLKDALGIRIATTNDDDAIPVVDIVKQNHEQLKADRPKQITPGSSVLEPDELPIEDDDDLALDQRIANADAVREQGLGL